MSGESVKSHAFLSDTYNLIKKAYIARGFVWVSEAGVICKKGVLNIFAKFQYRSLFFNKVEGLFIKKEAPAKVLSCKFYESFKNIFFMDHLRWLFFRFFETFWTAIL